MALQQSTPLLQAYIYKHTIVGDYVVKRYVQLYSNCFTTRRKDPTADPDGDVSTYELDRTGRLDPADAASIPRKRRHIRPHGVGSMTALAAIRRKGQAVELWTFKLEQDSGDFRFCFEDRAQAEQWHEQLSKVIAALASSPGAASRQSPAARPQTANSEESASDRESYAASTGSLDESANTASSGSNRRELQEEPSYILHPSNTYSPQDDEAALEQLMNITLGPSHKGRAARWVPYRHSNGLAIYQHQGQGNGKDNEYMVSAVVRGSPLEVLRALLDPSSPTTILGPAILSEVMESTPGRQVLRIQLQALGATAAWFRPREAVVQRLLNKNADGVYVVLFSSIDAADDSSQEFGVIEIPEGIGGSAQFSRPVRCRVSGGYTISKRQGYSSADSPESLLTCILQVQDMGGWLNSHHPLFRVVDWWSGGAYEAFLERMLLGVMLVRDIVEKSRFIVTPAAFVRYEESDEYSAAGEAAGIGYEAVAAADADKKSLQNLRTSTFAMREAAARLTQQQAVRSPHGRSHLAPRTPFESAAHSSPLSAGSYSRPVHQAGMLRKPSGTSRLASQRSPAVGSLSAGSQVHAAVAAAEAASAAAFSASVVSAAAVSASAPTASASKVEEPEPVFQLPSHYYEEIHIPGRDHPFKVRGASYLQDGHKVQAGQPMFELLGMEVVNTGGPQTCPHVSRFLKSVRRSSKPFLFVFNLMVPGPPTMCCVFVFGGDTHPDDLGPPPDDPEDSDWQPVDFLIWRFLNGDDGERCSLFKMIPHIAEGSWLIKQSVGTTPVILARKLATQFFVTQKYVEVAVDVGSSTTAQYVTGLVRGGAKNLVIDLGLVLEGHNSWELPEVLLGAVRVRRLDLAAASKLDGGKEVPMRITRTAAAAAQNAKAQ